jgi:hypothetical protein
VHDGAQLAQIDKRVTGHTLRHRFATHPLIARADKVAHARAALGFDDRRLGRGVVDQDGLLYVKPDRSFRRAELR